MAPSGRAGSPSPAMMVQRTGAVLSSPASRSSLERGAKGDLDSRAKRGWHRRPGAIWRSRRHQQLDEGGDLGFELARLQPGLLGGFACVALADAGFGKRGFGIGGLRFDDLQLLGEARRPVRAARPSRPCRPARRRAPRSGARHRRVGRVRRAVRVAHSWMRASAWARAARGLGGLARRGLERGSAALSASAASATPSCRISRAAASSSLDARSSCSS